MPGHERGCHLAGSGRGHTTISRPRRPLGRDRRHQQRGRQRIAAARNVAAHAVEGRTHCLEPSRAPVGHSPAPRHLLRCRPRGCSRPLRGWPRARRAARVAASAVACSASGTSSGPSSRRTARVASSAASPSRAHIVGDRARFTFSRHTRAIARCVLGAEQWSARSRSAGDPAPIDPRALQHAIYITILFSGYSTMPCAPASFSRGMMCARWSRRGSC